MAPIWASDLEKFRVSVFYWQKNQSTLVFTINPQKAKKHPVDYKNLATKAPKH